MDPLIVRPLGLVISAVPVSDLTGSVPKAIYRLFEGFTTFLKNSCSTFRWDFDFAGGYWFPAKWRLNCAYRERHSHGHVHHAMAFAC